MADKGYDALSNYNGVRERGGRLIAPARRRRGETAEAVAAQREQEERDIMENPPRASGLWTWSTSERTRRAGCSSAAGKRAVRRSGLPQLPLRLPHGGVGDARRPQALRQHE